MDFKIKYEDIDECNDRMILQSWKFDIDTYLQLDNNDLQLYKSKAMKDGEYLDPESYHKLKTKINHLSRLSQRIQIKLSILKKAEQNSVERLFINLVEKEIGFELFNDLMEKAKLEHKKSIN